ncbi:MAG: YbaK/EbsC family protein [Desulfobacteraceae bacterium]|nr:YbaK/EbsC family protein [Desulfobacteraceae bacterium]
MTRPRYPVTPAIRFLRAKRVDFKTFIYTYTDRGGARQAARELGVPEHWVVKTLVMETGDQLPLLVLMHGDQAVSTRKLARVIDTKKVLPVRPDKALNHTGYQVGGISPFGVRQPMPVYVQTTILELKTIYINGGKRGFIVAVDPIVLLDTLSAVPVPIAALSRGPGSVKPGCP